MASNAGLDKGEAMLIVAAVTFLIGWNVGRWRWIALIWIVIAAVALALIGGMSMSNAPSSGIDPGAIWNPTALIINVGIKLCLMVAGYALGVGAQRVFRKNPPPTS